MYVCRCEGLPPLERLRVPLHAAKELAANISNAMDTGTVGVSRLWGVVMKPVTLGTVKPSHTPPPVHTIHTMPHTLHTMHVRLFVRVLSLLSPQHTL